LNNLEECAQASVVFDCKSEVLALRSALERCLEAVTPWISNRRLTGRVRECHGDLHSANIVRLQSRLVAFDCMEFEPAFRWIDVAEEVAFLLMDLQSQGYPQHARSFLAGYLASSGDYSMCYLLPLYKAHRALVRAKVVALSQAGARAASTQHPQDTDRLKHRAYLECAVRALTRTHPTLVLMSGLSGSGKTWLAERLAPILGAMHLRSDVERKRLAGLPESARSGAAVGEGPYSREFTTRVYQHLASAAEAALAGGYTVIVDATFARHHDRDVFRKLARRLGVTACLIQCRASQEVLVNRIAERRLQGRDASEANIAVLDWQAQRWEPVAVDERWALIPVDTARVDLNELKERIAALEQPM